jgi:predicted adenylyl cyclase CyaB
MIEIEKKFFIKAGDFERLTEGAEFVSEKTHTDTYYDKKDFPLTTKDLWLRKRNSRFELKFRISKETKPAVDHYEEIETEEGIRDFLKMKTKGTFERDLRANGYFPICTYKTTRKKYNKDGFTLDFDSVDFGDFTYQVLEIELMVKDNSEIESASKKIVEFAKANGLRMERVRGKVSTYLSRYNPKHLQALVDADVCKK